MQQDIKWSTGIQFCSIRRHFSCLSNFYFDSLSFVFFIMGSLAQGLLAQFFANVSFSSNVAPCRIGPA